MDKTKWYNDKENILKLLLAVLSREDLIQLFFNPMRDWRFYKYLQMWKLYEYLGITETSMILISKFVSFIYASNRYFTK